MTFQISPQMAWLILLLAGLLEVVWAFSMKASDGFTRHLYTTITLVAAGLSFWLLGLAMRQLPLGTAYAVWVGIGTVGAAMLGGLFLGEQLTLPRLACIGLIVVGVLGLKLLSAEG